MERGGERGSARESDGERRRAMGREGERGRARESEGERGRTGDSAEESGRERGRARVSEGESEGESEEGRESKGYFKPDDRRLLRLMKEQYPDVDLRVLLYNAARPISNGKKTIMTYGDWLTKNGIKWSEGTEIPDSWRNE